MNDPYIEASFDAALNQGLWDEALNLLDEAAEKVDEGKYREMKERFNRERWWDQQHEILD